MRLDHVSYAVGPEGMEATSERLAELLGEKPVEGGIHPRFGTTNMVLPLAHGQYVEIVQVLDHPASDKAPFGQAVRERSAAGGGWLGWVVAVDDITALEERLERSAVAGNRHRPDGSELRWRQVGVVGLRADPQLPFFIQWESGPDLHPSADATGAVGLTGLEIAGDRARVADWLGVDLGRATWGLDLSWVPAEAAGGIRSVTFSTPDGPVRI
ncbi:MAG TPA: VOC family protein [Nocardioidaceae bacterium]|nr:VOC family protein [Nocardioidaceae bacterium]